jgi:hypothetical protein
MPSTWNRILRRWRLAAALIIVAPLLAVIGMGAPAQAMSTWHIHVSYAGDGMCLDAADAPGDPHQDPTKDGDKVQMWQCNGAINQAWTFHETQTDPPRFYITNDASGLCLDMNIANSDNSWTNFDGRTVQLWHCNGWPNQTWAQEVAGNGDALLQSIRDDGGTDDFIDAQNFGGWNPGMNGDQLLVWGYNDGSTQSWYWN